MSEEKKGETPNEDHTNEDHAPTVQELFEKGKFIPSQASQDKVIADKLRSLPDADLTNIYRMARIGLKLKYDRLTEMLRDQDDVRDAFLVARSSVEQEWQKLQGLERPEEQHGED